ncbi:carbon-nitrogen hydrolase [Spongiactinospora gelatinilytica]|uniref:Carbon-nitrogen hydrolase n=1 Tax=Spongiactinospora gelatinilytica TaxID=2666298 RepID=A0A2W2GBN9_9ACTN|nr:carbon-nitrogen family hydrolase [Spongiactinospora gelatinilytica]PZG31637.1 carbon-nitrogen hydrolase [Spongiactinospora gelatinilytica]
MRVALVQVASPPEEPPAERRERVTAMVAGARGADLVVLPELWAAGYFAFDAYAERAEPLEGPTVAAARAWATDLGAYVHAGSIVERDAAGRLFNTAVLVAPDGLIAHTYRKVHVFGYASREAELLTPGDTLDVCPTPFGPLAATTCYDLRFPELWRDLVDRGAQTVVVPAAWPAARREHWRLFTTCRAVEEQVLLIACNAAGVQHGGVELGGHSRVVDPWGTVLTEAGTDEGITFCDVDPAVIAKVRAEFPVLADRRWPYGRRIER